MEVEVDSLVKGMGTDHRAADVQAGLTGVGEPEINAPPDDRFSTLSVYENVVETVEEQGIARIEARDAALYKALNDIRTAGENCVSREGLREIVSLASETLSGYKEDLRSTRTVYTSLHEKVMHLALAAIKSSEESISFTHVGGAKDPQKAKEAASVFDSAVKLVIGWDEQVYVNGDSIDAIAKAVSNTGLNAAGSPDIPDFGSKLSAVAHTALEYVHSMEWCVWFRGQEQTRLQPAPELAPGREAMLLEAGSGLASARDFDPSDEVAAATLDRSMAEHGIGSYPGEVESDDVIARDIDGTQTEIEDTGYSM